TRRNGRERRLLNARTSSGLRMLRQGSAAIGRRRDDLCLRVHLLPRLRRDPSQRRLPQLRRQFRTAAGAALGKACEGSAVDPAYLQSGRLRPLTRAGSMPVKKLQALVFSAASVLFVAMCIPAAADDYPSRPIRLIIPFPPGGSNDIVGRIVANQLGQKLGQTVFVDNRAGAGGVVGTDVAAKAAPDGYTLLIISIAHAVDPFIYKEPYDPIKDFAPVAILATGTNVLSV